MVVRTKKIDNPYQKICKHRFCGKGFKAGRLNQDYCSGQCKRRENNYKAKLIRDLTKDEVAKQIKNEKILEQFYIEENYEVTINVLKELGFDFNCAGTMTIDKLNKKKTKWFFNYGCQALSEKTFMVRFKGNTTFV